MELEEYRNAKGLPVIPTFTPQRISMDLLIVKDFIPTSEKNKSVKEQNMTEKKPTDPPVDTVDTQVSDETPPVVDEPITLKSSGGNENLTVESVTPPTAPSTPSVSPAPATPPVYHQPVTPVAPVESSSVPPKPSIPTTPVPNIPTPPPVSTIPPVPPQPAYDPYEQQYYNNYNQQYYSQQYNYHNWNEQYTPAVNDTPMNFTNTPNTATVPHTAPVPGLADLPRDVSFFDEHATIIDTKTKKEPPEMGGRAFIKKLFPFINIGKGRSERDFDEINDSVFKTLSDTKKIGVMSLSGGSGASVSAVVISSICAERKGSRGIISIDANKDGNLGDRVSERKANGNVTIAARSGNVVTAAQINDLCTHNKDGVKVLSADRTPDYYSLTPNDYDALVKKLSPHYELILVDIPHSFNDPILPSVLRSLDGLFICTTTATDHIKNMEILINKLRNPSIIPAPPKIVVIMGHHVKGKPKARIAGVMSHLLSDRKIPAAFLVPFDEHIDEGGAIRFDALNKKTQYQYRKAVANMLDLIPSR